MGGDYTRFTFDPVKGFSGVHKQQGRVSLDSNFNELEEILDRRDRAEMYDTVGQAVVPMTTPHGFEIGVNGAGKLTIGQGRMYVDGILAECFGDLTDPTKTTFDVDIGNLVGNDPLVFDAQPFWYTKPPFPPLSPTPSVINLVYLDVWQREVTVFEDYTLREPALNGPDTDTRVQTAWQVKVMQNADATSCAISPAAFNDLTAASTGRLSSLATPAAPAPGPCIINPAGGYTGLENRFYRVEIHKAGTLGGVTKAQFKWSRDNASLAAKVVSTTKVTATDWIITVTSTGRDSWMRFEVGNHVELSMRETGTGGILARITSVNHATGEIHVDQDLTTLPIVAGRHPRIRRWDIASAAEPFTRDAANGVAIALENGITVTFGPGATDTLHAGDYWAFAARTADGTIDTLVSAPPRGILHHFAKLALVTSGAPPTVLTDCRIFWPPTMTAHEGCCSQVVKPGESIQKAIDKLKGIGGCVCLKMGVHHIAKPLSISQDNVTIHGEVPWVTVRLDSGGPLMLEITAMENVSVEGILFEAPEGAAHEPVINVLGVVGGRIADCGIRIIREKADPKAKAIGIALTRVRDYAIECVEMRDLPFAVLGIESHQIRVTDCELHGPSAELAKGGTVSLGLIGIEFNGGSLTGIDIERNILTDYLRGIQLGDVSAAAIAPAGGPGNPVDVTTTQAGCRIASNVVARHAAPTGVFGGGGGFFAIFFAIATHVARCEIVENAMNIVDLSEYGILAAGGDTLVARNEILSTATFDPNVALTQLPIGVAAIVTQADAVACTIRGNRFEGLQQAVYATGAASGFGNRVDVIENRVVGTEALVKAVLSGKVSAGGGSPIVKLLLILEHFSAISLVALSHSRVADNEIRLAPCGVFALATLATSVVANRVNTSLAGVMMAVVAECEASDNIVDASLTGAPTIGVALLGALRCVAERNAISNVASGIITALSIATRAQDNDVYITETGVISLIDVDLELRGNTIEDALNTSIEAIFPLHELTMAHDRVLRSGYRAGGMAPTPAVGILVLGAIGLVTIDSCHVIDTGESPDGAAPSFTGERHGIVVLFAIGTRVHGCTVASQPLVGNAVVNPGSRAIRLWTLTPAAVMAILGAVGRPMTPFADATDNVVEQSVAILVETLAVGEIMFATNRCINFVEGPKFPAVLLAGTHVTATGNRVKTTSKVPSLFAMFDNALSAVGNITTSGATIVPLGGAVQVPAPYPSFNATV
jgi:hypothetical protein